MRIWRSVHLGTLLASAHLTRTLIALIALSWLVMPAILILAGRYPSGDVHRFVEIYRASGTPYRDFPVEYAPLQALFIRSVFPTDMVGEILVVLVNASGTVGSFILLRRTWSLVAANIYLLLSLPLQLFMPFQIDAFVAMIALAAVVLARDGRQVLGGSAMAGAILFRLWPVVILPVLRKRREGRAIPVCLAITGAGMIGWLLVGGLAALRQVVGFRDATGWHIESSVGVLVSLFSSSQERFELGTYRIGTISPWQPIGLGLVLAVALGLVWIKAMRTSIDPAGMPAVAAIAGLLVLSPLFSPQFLAWLIPGAAIAITERRRPSVAILSFGAVWATSLGVIVFWTLRVVPALEILDLARVACVAGLFVSWLVEGDRVVGARDPRHPSWIRSGRGNRDVPPGI